MYMRVFFSIYFLVACSAILASHGLVDSAPSSGSSNSVASKFSEMYPPPVKPENFKSKHELKNYLVDLHNYYSIISRPRFGKRASYYHDEATNNLWPAAAAGDAYGQFYDPRVTTE
jgi:hypothetical protein